MAEKAIIYYSNLNSNVAEINRVHPRIGLHFLKSGKKKFLFLFWAIVIGNLGNLGVYIKDRSSIVLHLT